MPTCWRRGASSCRARPRRSRATRACASRIWATERRGGMEQLIQQVASGLANGAIYASLALAPVMIFVSTNHINFAQGEMARFSAYLAWQLMEWCLSVWLGLPVTRAPSFAAGVAIERTIL